MKKYVIILSVVLVISILLVGCNTKNKLSVFYVNETDLWETKSREHYTDKKITETISEVSNSSNYKINQINSGIDKKSKKILSIVSDILSQKLSKQLVDDILDEIIKILNRK